MPVGRGKISGPDIGQVIGNVGSAITRGSYKTLERAALKAKAIETNEIRSATGGDMRLSGVNRARGRPGNARVGVRYDIKRGDIPSAVIRATGPLHLIERPTSPHFVTSAWGGSRSMRAARLGGSASFYRRGRKGQMGESRPSTLSNGSSFITGSTRGGRTAVLNIPGIPRRFRRYATHPGTKGKYPFAKGQKKAEKPVARIMRTRTFDIIKKAAKP